MKNKIGCVSDSKLEPAREKRQAIVTQRSDYGRPLQIGVTWNQRERVIMKKAPARFDLQTVTFLKAILDDAWARLPPERQATTQKTALAERILKTAAQGERDRERLLDAALDIRCAGQRA
ncbi:MAG: hypothetical protein ACRECG_04850 [Bradyrhizobium sp.]